MTPEEIERINNTVPTGMECSCASGVPGLLGCFARRERVGEILPWNHVGIDPAKPEADKTFYITFTKVKLK